MAAIIFRILGAVFFVWLFRRLLSALLRDSRKSQSAESTEEAANQMVKDPICGMYMDSRLAVRLESRRENFYFCSEECKKKYLSNPGGTGAAGASPPRQ
jgi:uncharacterized protein